MASKLCILGFEPFKSSLIAELCGFRIRHCQGDMWVRTACLSVKNVRVAVLRASD
jgi:hypothetical protein